VQAENIETMLADDTDLEWYGVSETAEVAGQTLAEANIRDEPGVSSSPFSAAKS